MDTATRVAAAAASGYILGRTKKLKLAIAVGSMLAGRRIATDPRGMAQQAGELVQSRPELAMLSEQIRSTLYTAARGAAVGVVSHRIDALSDSIRERSDRLTGTVTEKVPLHRGSGDEDEDEERSDSRSDENQDEPDEDQDEGRGSRRARRGDDGGDGDGGDDDASGPEGSGAEEPGERSRPRQRAAKKAPAKRSASGRGDAPARKRTASRKSTSSGRSRSGSRG